MGNLPFSFNGNILGWCAHFQGSFKEEFVLGVIYLGLVGMFVSTATEKVTNSYLK